MFKFIYIFFVFLSVYETQGQWRPFMNYYSKPKYYAPGGANEYSEDFSNGAFNPYKNIFSPLGHNGYEGYPTIPGFDPFNYQMFQPHLRSFPAQFPVIDPFSMVQDMGKQIQEQVQKTLLPITQTIARQSMSKGIGGVTIVTIPRLNLKLLLSDGVAYNCQGTVVKNFQTQPTCSGNLIHIQDVCVPGQNFIQFNDIKCFGDQASMYNGVCVNGKQMSLADLKARCGQDYDTNNYAQYDYYPTTGNFNAVNIQNSGVICINSDKDHCIFN